MERPLRLFLLADVILPLPLADTYTYHLPETMRGKVEEGSRLIVPFGIKKIYSAIVLRVYEGPYNDEKQLKDAIDLLDDAPILLPSQLWLWRWIADYYLCTLGEVYKAALPSGLKLESESVVVYNPDYAGENSLTKTEQHLLDLMEHLGKQKVLDLQKVVEVKNVLPVVKSLLEKGALTMHEELRQNYRPRTVNCVRLTEEFFSQDRLNDLFDQLKRAQRQADLLLRYLDFSKAAAALTLQNRSLLVEIEKQTLMEGQSETAFRGLKERGVLEVYEKEVPRIDPSNPNFKIQNSKSLFSPSGETEGGFCGEIERGLQLSSAQNRAYTEIQTAFATHDTCLLHGVTSSGKTEIYIRLIQEQITQGRQVLYMLPEIVLTAQLVERLRRVFGSRLGVYHSKYPDAERVEVWKRQLSSQPYDIIVGVRSSIFLPFQRLGLVIVDEEHENSFKQQEPAPRYHARNVALVMAHHMGAKTLLGTATPSLESYYNAQTGKYALVTLSERYGQVQLPLIRVVDIRQQRHRKEMKGVFTTPLLQAMREALDHRQQVILFQNRRGYAPQVECQTCGWTPRCTHCDVTLTQHHGSRQMVCHYCGATYPIPQRCPQCEGHELLPVGYGTERIEEDLQQHFPQARIARMDLDTTRSRMAYERLLADFERGHIDILVGTQMVTKGLDFDHVSVVGILNADSLLNQPDFRSHERAFQLMSQVAGRAGRRHQQGLVIMQTRSPELPLISQVVANDYPAFYLSQVEERQAFRYPPFSRLIYVHLRHRNHPTVARLASDMATLLRRQFGTRVLGPDTPSVSRIAQMWRRQFILKIETTASMADARRRLRQIQHHLLSQPQYRSAQIIFDVDPM